MTNTDDDLLELEVGNIAAGGGCVARDPEGRVVFVRHTLPGERVVAWVTSTASKYRRADAIEILEPSEDRVEPPCPYAGPGRCGGCDFQHASLTAQRLLKAQLVREQLQRVAGIDHPVEVEAVPGDDQGLGWRTRLRLAVTTDGRLAFRAHRSHDLVPVEGCPIAHPAVTATGIFDGVWPSAIKEIEVVTGGEGGGAMVIVESERRATTGLPHVEAGVIARGKVVRGPSAVQIAVGTTTFRVSAGVFWQVHAGAALALSDAVRSALHPRPGDAVVDLYAGAGLFAVRLAAEVGPKGSVLAVERDRRACADTQHNGKDFPQLKVLKESVTPEVVAGRLGQPDLLVLDPAREGAGTPVMRALVAQHSATLRRLVYVSCDAASFSRDSRVLLDAGWTMDGLRAFDIFPMTEHVELVASFTPPAAGDPA